MAAGVIDTALPTCSFLVARPGRETKGHLMKHVGSWWINDGLDGRRLEAEKFASTLGALSQFD